MGTLITGGIYGGDLTGEQYVKTIWFEQINSGTSGTLTVPEQGEIVLDQWSAGVDALASTISSGIPAFISPTTAGGAIITATLNSSGTWTLTGTPSSYPVAIIYVYKVKLRYFDYTKQIGGYELILTADGVSTNVTAFNKILSSADNEVQKALDTLDDHIHTYVNRWARPGRLFASDGSTLKQIYHSGASYQASPANGDRLQMFFICDGTETKLSLGMYSDNYSAKFDIYVNGVLDSSGYDNYAPTMIDNFRYITLTQPITAGLNTIELRVNGKNTSSGGYYVGVYGASLQ